MRWNYENGEVQVRFLLGPAGSGKTYRCLNEIRGELSSAPDGIPLVLVAPKQTTYELERQLLSGPSTLGYTRLQVLSFERLAEYVFAELGVAPPELLADEGRVMVLRALLARKRQELRLFRASARLTGFAQQLSSVLAEFQQSQLRPELVRQLAKRMGRSTLSMKLHDLAELMEEYEHWLEAHSLQDRERLLDAATEALIASRKEMDSDGPGPCAPRLQLYVDGFAEFAETEIDLVAALLPWCAQATITFCLSEAEGASSSWLSDWFVTRRALERCRQRLAAIPGTELTEQHLAREPQTSRFGASKALQYMERHWSGGEPWETKPNLAAGGAAELRNPGTDLRIVSCSYPEAEVTLAAREILAFVRGGGRYRETAVLVRNLDSYHQVFLRVFPRYEIPFFLDRRQAVGHHPLAELTRSALRTVVLGWQHDDWFAVLKTGLVPARDEEIDRLENEALARGWQLSAWQRPLRILEAGRTDQDKQRLRVLEAELERVRRRLIPPLQGLAMALRQANNRPTGLQLGAAIRNLWSELKVAEQLQQWTSVPAAGAGIDLRGAHHETVWNAINGWLANLELAFSTDPLPVREWLPVLEAGLANLTIGLIPPALDQVLIGTVDRSRNPDIKLGLVLGMNETLFPASPAAPLLLTTAERTELERHGVMLGVNTRLQMSRERHLAYIACTRPRERLLLTLAEQDAEGNVLNPSPFLTRFRQIFPALEVEAFTGQLDWRQYQHPHELFPVLARQQGAGAAMGVLSDERPGALPANPLGAVSTAPAMAPLLNPLRTLRNPAPEERLAPHLAEQLYGPVLRTSVSRMEQFAACPFKFFIHSGMRAEERKLFELDVKEQGSFQHDVLALFHEQLQSERKRWRDITPAEGRARVSAAATALLVGYREGLLEATEQTRFLARAMTESLQDFVEVLVGWMRQQYEFDPVRVELPFGESDAQPAWIIELGRGHRLEVYGRIDRVDLYRVPAADEALCVVVDYKSSQKQLDTILMAHGLQLQLLTYLNVLREWPQPKSLFGVSRLIPAGVFYVNLRGKYSSEKNRLDALADPPSDRKLAYRHAGRFDVEALPHLDCRTGPRRGDQFNFTVLKDGRMHKRCPEAVAPTQFRELLEAVKRHMATMGRRVYSGVAALDPFRKSSATACDQCLYQWICRIDPWTHRYRVLRAEPAEGTEEGQGE